MQKKELKLSWISVHQSGAGNRKLDLYFRNRKEWRSWLERNHSGEKKVWLIDYKKHTDKERIPYDDAVEEALCYGWIDSTVKRMDEERYKQKFTPRNDRSEWSELNKKRVEKLISDGSMTDAGLSKVAYAKESGAWDKSPSGGIIPERSAEFENALESNETARIYFEKLAPSHKKRYLAWITSAKRDDTRIRRIEEAVRMLSSGQKFGMK